MKAPVVLLLGLVAGATLATLAVLGSRASGASALEAEAAGLRQALQRAERSAAAAAEEARSTREKLAAHLRVASPPIQPRAEGPVRPAGDARNTAIMTYLGEAVPAPADLDPRYSAAALAATFRGLCAARGVTVAKLGVDTSEFPYVLHGVLEGETARDFFLQITTRIGAAPGYAYGGSVTGRTSDGGVHFSLNMTPGSTYPREQADAIRRRLMLRLQMIDAAWVDPVR